MKFTLVIAFFINFCFTPHTFAQLSHSITPSIVTPSTLNILMKKKSVREEILSQFKQWEGVKYKWGGQTSDGVDCSAFAQIIYSKTLMKKLPRTTHDQILEGIIVDINQLQPGDLVFFKTKKWFAM